ncbi:vacuolar protein sorting-associated protein 3, partial [Phenoliferia sp. Uapishka_3]
MVGPTASVSTTPLRPLELPPFALYPLLERVFTPASSLPSSPIKQSPGSPTPAATSTSLSRLGQLGNLVGASTSGGEGGVVGQVSVRSVEASGEQVWIGASDGRVRRYQVDHIQLGNRFGRATSPISTAGRRTPTSPGSQQVCTEDAVLDLTDESVVTQSRKAADRIALIERLNMAVILSEGILTFHSMPNLTPLSVHSFPAMKGVTTFSLDEDELSGGGREDAMHLCAIKRRTVHLLKVTKEGVTHVKDLPLRGGALVSTLRRQHVCIADAETYYIIDFENAIATPLLPISQSPNEDDARPLSSSSTSTSVTPPPPGGFDPRQRPAVACVGTNEFLIASHTGSTTLGVFVTETGEPCRGTLEWSSNLRSLTVDAPYVVALLHNNSIEIHSIHTQEIVQMIHLPVPSVPSPFSLQPRSLVRSWTGLELGSATGANKVDVVSVPLLPSNHSEPPRTPTRSSGIGEEERGKGKGTAAKTLVVGKNSLYALTPLTLVVQADALMEKGRVEDALSLAKQIESSSSLGNPEVSYVYLRAAYHAMGETLFQEAFDLFLRSGCDPRLVVRMFPDLREPLLRPDEEISVFQGIKMEVITARTIDDFIMSNLNRNYSPHIKPDVESASPTIELRTMLAVTARDCVRVYLTRWRAARRGAGSQIALAGDSRKVDMVVDTTLVRLLAEERKTTSLLEILEGPNDCVFQHVEQFILEAGMYDALASLYLKREEFTKTLDIWTKLVDGEYNDATYTGGVQRIFDTLWESRDKSLVEKYGVWLIQRDQALGLKLFSDPKQTLTFDTRELFGKIRKFNGEVADLFLENAVLQKRSHDSGLHADLIKRYIDRLGELLADPSTKAHLRDQEKSYAELVASTSQSSPPSFLYFLASRFTTTSPHGTFDRVRLKAILFLNSSANYDVAATKKVLDDMEVRGLRGLTLERAIVYGKLRLDRQALSLLLHSLQDLTSSETYCHQSGDPLLASDVSAAAARLSLLLPKTKRTTSSKKEGQEQRKAGLARLLVEMCLVGRGGGEDDVDAPPEVHKEQVARILETQAVHLDTLEVLPTLPSQWPLALVSGFLERSLRRSLHIRQEAALLKGLALSQNLDVTDRVGQLQVKMGPRIQKDGAVAIATDAAVGPTQVIPLVEKKEKENISDDVDEMDLR